MTSPTVSHFLSLSLLASLLASPLTVSSAPANAKVTSLPDLQGTFPNFPLYSGYIDITSPSNAQHHMFYFLVESASSTASTDDLVVWLTGGLGCSSLYALFSENGFANINSDTGAVTLNKYSWNQNANMLYIEAPCGVGFSYSDDGTYTTGDDLTAEDNYNFIVEFMNVYPEYKNRRLYVSGESYAGHYTPQLSYLLYTKPIPGVINFQGFIVGNPSFEGDYDGQYYWPFMSYHGLTSLTDFEQASGICNNTFYGPLSPACAQALSALRANIPYTNPYNILASCDGPPSLDGSCFTMQSVLSTLTSTGAGAGSITDDIRVRGGSQTVVPCMNVSYIVAYLRRADVQEALHVTTKPTGLPAWDVCSSAINYTQYAPTVRPIYVALKDKVNILVLSGDVDSCVPFLGTQAGIDSLGWEVEIPYIRWWVYDSLNRPQIAGYLRTYTSSTQKIAAFATIRGAGHMASGAEIGKPAAALALFNAYLNGGTFPITPPPPPPP